MLEVTHGGANRERGTRPTQATQGKVVVKDQRLFRIVEALDILKKGELNIITVFGILAIITFLYLGQ